MLKPTKQPFVKPRRGPKPKYPFATMKRGEGFNVPVRDGTPTLRSMVSYACLRGRQMGRKFSVLRVSKSSIRVYRSK